MIYIPKLLIKKMRIHSEKTYPYECCGVLAGKDGLHKMVIDVFPVENINKDRSKDRYEIDPKELLEIDRKIRESGKDIIGFYHSHPEHPPLPSNFDAEHAWSGYSYIILSIFNGIVREIRSWTFDEKSRQFNEEHIEEDI